MATGLAPAKKQLPPPPPAAKKPVKRARSNSTRTNSSSSTASSSSGSDQDEDEDDDDDDDRRSSSSERFDDPDDVPLFLRAKHSGIMPEADAIAALTAEEAPTATGPPPRPKMFNLPPGSLALTLERAKIALQKTNVEATIKDNNKTISLGTSKTNYIDPRIVYSWANEFKVLPTKVFNKSLQDKFPWAKDASNYVF
jgi:DNA topoisomerase-1